MMKAFFIISAASFFLELFGVSWEAVDEKIARQYPEVAALEVSELAAQMARQSASPIVIDVRASEEFAVSHLESAQNFSSAAAIAQRFPDRDTDIVVYCSVGYRSAEVARELERMGYRRVLNLRHSIFAWANQGLPLVNNDGETTRVHPYNRIWGSLLDENRHSYRP